MNLKNNINYWRRPEIFGKYLEYIQSIPDGIKPWHLFAIAYKQFLEKYHLNPGKILVELGSGSGNVSAIFVENFHFNQILLVDCSEYALYLSPGHISNHNVSVKLQLADLNYQRVQMPDKSTDLVISCSLTGYLESLDNILSEAKRILKNGCFFIFSANLHDKKNTGDYIYEMGPQGKFLIRNETTFKEDLKTKHGFEIIHEIRPEQAGPGILGIPSKIHIFFVKAV